MIGFWIIVTSKMFFLLHIKRENGHGNSINFNMGHSNLNELKDSHSNVKTVSFFIININPDH